ncbi:MAG: cell division protein FtsZ [Alteromonadaceae bacterium]|nr:MAG: cell division protein FtsZ [Alteromonadaceae bacterium]
MYNPGNDAEDVAGTNNGNGSSISSPSGSTVVKYLKACQNIASERARVSFGAYLKDLDAAFSQEIQHSRSNQRSTEMAEMQHVFRKRAKDLARYYCGYLAEGFVKFKKGQLNTLVGSDIESASTEQLSLVGNDALEEAISITTLTQRADAYFAEPLWALNHRLAVLNQGERVTEASNPAAPVQYCESLRKALRLIKLQSAVRNTVYKVFDSQLLSVTGAVVEELNQYLKTEGVLPHLRYAMPRDRNRAQAVEQESVEAQAPFEDVSDDDQQAFDPLEGEARPSYLAAFDPDLSPDEYQHHLLGAIRNLQNQIVSNRVHNMPVEGVAVTESDLVHALQVLQGESQATVANFSEVNSAAIAPADLSQFMTGLREHLKDEVEDDNAAVGTGSMATIDLVGMLFEYMLNDESLPDTVKALLSYLHTPFLKVAFIDPGFFEQTDHPARLLLNTLADAGSRWVGNDGTSQFEIFSKIKEVVDVILREFSNEIKVITTQLLEFSSYTKNIRRRQELMEKRATEKAQGEERLREVKVHVNSEIKKRTDNRDLPSTILLFLLQPWSDYMSFALLRFGLESPKWNDAVSLVDHLLWCITPKLDAYEQQKQKQMSAELLESIERGFDTIGYDQAKGKKLVEGLSLLLQRAIRRQKVESVAIEERRKLERQAAEKAGAPIISDGDVTPEEDHMVESLKMIEFGTWFEFKGGKRLKVAWYNARTSHYMLVDQMGKRVDMMAGIEMARQMISGETKIISGSSKPFFERALENIFRKLHENAEANKAPVESGGANA